MTSTPRPKTTRHDMSGATVSKNGMLTAHSLGPGAKITQAPDAINPATLRAQKKAFSLEVAPTTSATPAQKKAPAAAYTTHSEARRCCG